MALENDGDGDDTYIFDILTNDLHLFYDVDGPGPVAPVDIVELDGSTGMWNTTSDIRLKKEVHRMDPILHKMWLLHPSNYLYTHQEYDTPEQIGFIAQEVLEVFPNLVKQSEAGYYRINYDNFGVLAIKAIQQQQDLIDKYQQDLAKLSRQVEELKSMILQQQSASVGQ